MIIQTDQSSELSSISHYRIHPELIPFVGSDYDKYRILIIGESHYINQPKNASDIALNDFSEWWEKPCPHLLENSEGWVNTRGVIDNYMSGKSGSYGIFTNVVKSFSKTVLKREIKRITLEDKQLFSHFSFMNFFQMPSLYNGMKYWDSLRRSAKLAGDKNLAEKVWKKCVEVSASVTDEVIEILKPKTVIFVSISAGNAYRNASTKQHSDTEIIYTSHPSTPFTWNKALKSLNGKKGKDVLEDALLKIYK